MTLTEHQKKMLSRIASDSPIRGDGQEFLKLLAALEADAYRESAVPDDVMSRWAQGKGIGFKELLKQFKDANK